MCGIDSHLKLVTTLLLLLAAVVAAELATECGQQLQKAGVATLMATRHFRWSCCCWVAAWQCCSLAGSGFATAERRAGIAATGHSSMHVCCSLWQCIMRVGLHARAATAKPA